MYDIQIVGDQILCSVGSVRHLSFNNRSSGVFLVGVRPLTDFYQCSELTTERWELSVSVLVLVDVSLLRAFYHHSGLVNWSFERLQSVIWRYDCDLDFRVPMIIILIVKTGSEFGCLHFWKLSEYRLLFGQWELYISPGTCIVYDVGTSLLWGGVCGCFSCRHQFCFLKKVGGKD